MIPDSFRTENKALLGILYDSIESYKNFTHVKSVFSDKWYNFIVPIVGPDSLDWEQVKKICTSEEASGVELSFYIPEHLQAAYRMYFNQKDCCVDLGTDCGMFGENSLIHTTVGKIIEVDDTLLEKYLQMVTICFPEWDNNVTYSKYFYELSKNNSDRIIKNYLYEVGEQIVGFGSTVVSKNDAIAYVHNTGILPEHRRQGHFTNLITALSNVALQQGVDTSFALVEKDGSSYLALQKMGFKPQYVYYLFEISKKLLEQTA